MIINYKNYSEYLVEVSVAKDLSPLAIAELLNFTFSQESEAYRLTKVEDQAKCITLVFGRPNPETQKEPEEWNVVCEDLDLTPFKTAVALTPIERLGTIEIDRITFRGSICRFTIEKIDHESRTLTVCHSTIA